ncbi:hypothetical protein [Cellulomonas carbonis]|uniref:Uncharacterized protein n=1 Tax=Cellulomonas carbonis T26 TaxID=947969 RepID=A0A0A0BTL5_9CELL|nr:hypothetical protein [Cellulomonas carbonis]KGM10524.1 hypothetical protein N868_14660 [Cellulomonas carbonis T26]
MIIDCGTCSVRGDACADCVVTFLTIPVRAGADASGARPGAPGRAASTAPCAGAHVAQRVHLDEAERRAIEVLASSGLVPPLRAVRAG